MTLKKTAIFKKVFKLTDYGTQHHLVHAPPGYVFDETGGQAMVVHNDLWRMNLSMHPCSCIHCELARRLHGI